METNSTFSFLRAFISSSHKANSKITKRTTGALITSGVLHLASSVFRLLSCVLCLASISLDLSAQTYPTFHDYSAATIYGDTINMSRYYGKKVMVVNTASFCAYTPEFTDLQTLYTLYRTHNFEIIGYPCDDFGGQDPYGDSAINAFCSGTYGVNFQMMSKVAIISQDTAPVYKWLQRQSLNGVEDAAVAWNFNKYLIDEAGHWVRHYLSPVSPLDTSIINWILSPSVLPPDTSHEFSYTSGLPHFDSVMLETRLQPYSSSTQPLPNLNIQNQLSGHGANQAWANLSAGDATGISSPLNDADWIQLKSPNPTGSVIEFQLDKPVPEKLSIRMYSVEGRWIDNIYEGTVSGKQDISYPVASIPAGIYLINIQGPDIQRTIRYIVAH